MQKICIFAQKHQLELMHEGIMVFISTNTPFLKSPGARVSLVRIQNYYYFGSQKFDCTVTCIIRVQSLKFPF